MAIHSEIPTAATVWSLLKQKHAARDFRDQTGLRWHPSQLEECLAARGAVLPPPLNAQEIEELKAAHARWNADAATVKNIDLLAERNTRVVVTGQQPGLLAGPLLVIYKTLAAIKLCAELQQKHPEFDFIPVFWVAAEDHDFDEVRRTIWAGHNGTLEEVLLTASATTPGAMVGPVSTADYADEIVSRIESSTHKTEFQADVLALVRQAYASDLEAGFCKLLLALLRGSGLVIVSPLMRWIRRRSAEILRKEFETAGQSSRLALERGERLRAFGFEPALHRADGVINAFWLDEQNRRFSMRVQEGQVFRRLAGVSDDTVDLPALPPLTPTTLLAMLMQNPEQFSTNVVTRPLAQDSILPTIAQTVGPGEAAYLAQVEAVYESFGVFAPVRFPRPQILLIEPRVERQLAKYRITLEEALERDATQLAELVLMRDAQEHDVRQVETLRARQLVEIENLKKKIGGDLSVSDAFDRLAQSTEKGYAKILERILYLRQRDEGHSLKAMGVVANSLRPGADQERALNPIVPFAVNHGLDWPLRIAEKVSVDPAKDLQIINLGGPVT